MGRVTVGHRVRRYADGVFATRPDVVAGEEPLELRGDGRVLTVTMRTPGADLDLVHGWLFTEGLIEDPSDVRSARYCAGDGNGRNSRRSSNGGDTGGSNTYNVLDVAFVRPLPSEVADRAARLGLSSSACGVCGAASIDALRARARFALDPDRPRLEPTMVAGLPTALAGGQRGFRRTGGMHAAGLADPQGRMRLVREDVGRHNAVDKVLGAALLAGEIPVNNEVLVTTSRASFELVQKAVMAGVGMLVAVSAPSSLACELADEMGLTLVGFTRDTSFNVYTHPQRVTGA